MLEYETKARELAQSVTGSEQYREYRDAMYKVKNDEFLMVRINDYRRKYFEIQCVGQGNRKSEIDRLYNEFQDVLENGDAKRFLDAEMTLCRMLQKISTTVLSDLEMDMDFL